MIAKSITIDGRGNCRGAFAARSTPTQDVAAQRM
jgi:hypothetical protein